MNLDATAFPTTQPPGSFCMPVPSWHLSLPLLQYCPYSRLAFRSVLGKVFHSLIKDIQFDTEGRLKPHDFQHPSSSCKPVPRLHSRMRGS
jgi:hypothetical protein